MKPFFLHDQKVKTNTVIKYLENEKSFEDETKNIFHHFQSAFIETNKTNYFWKERARLPFDA